MGGDGVINQWGAMLKKERGGNIVERTGICELLLDGGNLEVPTKDVDVADSHGSVKNAILVGRGARTNQLSDPSFAS